MSLSELIVKSVKNDTRVPKLTLKCPIDDTQLSIDDIKLVIATTKTVISIQALT